MAHSELEAGPSQSLAKLPLTPTSRPLAAEHVTATDTDTCRICRGEGTVSEPLFFPCKCSGSIKYVHQDCLMEWLSHSQKKHCELCKTPFRFTKLYDPNMPKTLPPFVFVRHMTKYLVRNLLVWLRAILVVSIWLGWVPYAMRAAWSLLFWISDEGLGGGSASLAAANGSGVPAWRGWRGTFSLTGDRTCPSSPLFAATTTVSTIGGVMNQVETDDGMLPALLRLLHRWNLTDPLYSSVLKLFLGTPPISPTPLVVNTISEAAPGLMKALSHNHTSLLSDVDFLRNIARHPVVSRTIIAILEGQIITVLVIISFILIILVRDYVVQQQPEINMRAAFAAAENLPVIPPPGPAQNAPNQAGRPAQENRDEVDNAPSPASENQGAPTRPQPAGNADIEQRNVQATPEGSAPSGAVQGSSSSAVSVGATGAEGRLVRQRVVTPLSDAFQARPENTTPSESATAPTPGSSGDSLRVKDFSRISRKAGGDREKFLQIIKDENLEDALQYWVQLTNAQNERDHHNGESSGLWQSRPSPESSGSHASGHMAGNYISETSGSATGSAALAPRPRTPLSDSSSSRSALEPAAPAQSDMDTAAASLGKGKGKDAETHLSVDGGLYPSRSASSRSDWMQGVSSMRPQPTSDTSTTHLVEPETPSLSRSASSQMSGRQSDVALSGAWIDSVGPPDRPGDENTLPSIPDDRSLAGTSDVTGVLHDLEDVSMVAQASIAGDSLDSSDFPTEGEQNAAAPTRPPEVHHRHQARGVFGRLAEFMWGGIEARPHEHGDGGDDAAEDGHDFADVDMDDVDEDFGRDDDGAAPGMDPEAVEDAEDFEGIMELIGMRGPIAGLFQNAIFCAFLVVITILLGIFVPYNIGRAAIWTVVNPTRPIRVVIGLSKFIQDLTMLVVGLAILVISVVPYLAGMLIGWNPLQDYLLGLFKESTNITALSYNRIIDGFVSEPFISASEIRNFSAISHASLLTLKQHLLSLLALAAQGIEHVASGQLAMSRTEFLAALSKTTASAWEYLASLQHVISHPGSWVINFQSAQTKVLVDPELAYWNGWDRFWAILFGYMAISLVAGLYLRRGVPFSSSQTGQEWEASIIDALNQASGVMKVILIISIEMLIFPLYCGMLLDVALLPLFENTTILSRILFTYNKPLTSIFVHWFVGTGYMFHFALFVSMCRKIMRKGVLCKYLQPAVPLPQGPLKLGYR